MNAEDTTTYLPSSAEMKANIEAVFARERPRLEAHYARLEREEEERKKKEVELASLLPQCSPTRSPSAPRSKAPAWDKSDRYKGDLQANLHGSGDGLRYSGVKTVAPQYNDAQWKTFAKAYKKAYKAVCVDKKTGEIVGPTLGRLYEFLAKKRPIECYLYLELAEIEYQREESAAWYHQNKRLLPRLLNAEVEILEKAGRVTITDFPARAVFHGRRKISKALDSDQGAAISESLHAEPWLRPSKHTIFLLWEFGFQNLKAWLEEQVGVKAPSLWLGQKRGANSKVVRLVAGEEELFTVGGWD